MNLLRFLLGFVSGLVFVTITAAAAYFYLTRSKNRRANVRGYLDVIPDLTEQQRALVQEIRRGFLPKVAGFRQNLRSKRTELADLLFDERTDRAAIHVAAEKIIEHQSELEREVIAHMLEEKEILSAPQQRKFHEIVVEQFASGGLGVHGVGRNRT
jgi:Spy/CpxP family protein refolding chaperone